ncbi:MAG: NAD(P)(+) transhydrogenase (Re/Si-specific) subunit alpha [Chloroflexota bacterium]
MLVGVVRETFPGERRVALTPMVVTELRRSGFGVVIEAGAGLGAGFPDRLYAEAGAEVVLDREEVFGRADIIAQVRGYGANPEAGRRDLGYLRPGQVLVGFFEPIANPEAAVELASRGVTVFALELLPRISRAQSMDALSSQATVVGYKGVLLAAEALPKMFPMLVTAAGTIKPAKVLVIGVGVAGLQAIATARRLGAVVSAYDVRPAAKEEAESVGARFIELGLETVEVEAGGGYAREMGEEFYRRQRQLLGDVLAEHDVVITAALVVGRRAPVLVTAEMVRRMRPGSVIVDLAAERGGNCEVSRAGETVEVDGVKVIGAVNLAATVPYDASQMYGRNVGNFLRHVFGRGGPDFSEEITRETLLVRAGEVVSGRVRQLLGLPPLVTKGTG